MEETVSIIIPTYNRKSFLQKNLEAIGKQHFNGYLEVFVIDDGSTDGTIQMLEGIESENVKFLFKYFKTLHCGPANSRNIGIQHSKGRILIFLDDDSVIQNNDYVQEIVKSFNEDDVGIVAGKSIDILSGTYRLVKVGDLPEIKFDKPSTFKDIIGIPTKNAAFLRDAVEKAGGFNTIFKYAYEDTDLCIKIRKLNYKLVLNEKALIHHYCQQNFLSYVKRSYFNGIANGIFRSIYPDKPYNPYNLSLIRFIVLPLLSMRNFAKRARQCYSEKMFSKSYLKEIPMMFLWLNAGYYAHHLGELSYLKNKLFKLMRMRLKILRDLCRFFMDLAKYFIKDTVLPGRRYFIFYLTNNCNQHCKHCFFSSELNKNTDTLTVKEIKKIVDNYYQFTNIRRPFARVISQGFTGGEPFLRDDLLEVISLFKNAGVNHFQINTNGLLTEKIVNFCDVLIKRQIYFLIVISLDGLEETHDKIRNTPGAFRKALHTIECLKDMGVKTSVIFTINAINYSEVKELVRFVNKKFDIEPGLQLVRGANQINISPEVQTTHSPEYKDVMITKDIIPEIRRIIFDTYLEKSIESPLKMVDFAKRFTYIELHLNFLENGEKISNCNAGRSMGVIYQNGDVSLCEMYKPIGNLRKNNFDLLSIWNNQDSRKQRGLVKKCQCTHDCFINTMHNLKFTKRLLINIRNFYTFLRKQ